MDPGSVSSAALSVRVGGGPPARVRLKRHLAPRTVGALLRSLPLSGNAHFMSGAVYVQVPADAGGGKQSREFAAGDVAFYSAGRSVCFFTSATESARPMTKIGAVESGIDALVGASSGDVVSITQDAV